MRHDLFQKNIGSLLKQRNLLFPICIILSLSQLFSVVFLFLKKERIVILPAEIDKAFWVESNRVSPTYLEQMALFISQLILSKSFESAAVQREIVLRHTLPKFYGAVKDFLIAEEEHLKKEGGSYQFFPTSIEVISNKNKVLITGEKTSFIGQRIVSKERENFSIEFVFKNGKLYLSSLKEEKI